MLVGPNVGEVVVVVGDQEGPAVPMDGDLVGFFEGRGVVGALVGE